MSISNKHKEIKQIVRSRYSIGGEFHEDGRSGLCITYEQLEETEKELRNLLFSALLQQLEELERWVESEIQTINYPEGADYLTIEALKSVLSHIREQKEIIKKQ